MRDPLSGPIAAIVKKLMPKAHSWATVLSYNRSTKRAVVVTQPDGRRSREIPVGVSSLGDGQSIPLGTQVKVTLDDGSPDAVVAIFHSNTDPVPDNEVTFDGDVRVPGTIRASGGLTLTPAHVAPDSSNMERGYLYSIGLARDHEAGAADELWWIGQKSDGTWHAYRLMQAT